MIGLYWCSGWLWGGERAPPSSRRKIELNDGDFDTCGTGRLDLVDLACKGFTKIGSFFAPPKSSIGHY